MVSESAGRHIKAGLSWNLLFRFLCQSIQFAVSVVLARLLGPSDFGAYGVVAVLTGFCLILADFGLSSALVQRSAINEIYQSSAFWFQIFLSMSIAVLFWISSGIFVWFFQVPNVEIVLRISSFIFLCQSLGQTQGAILQREFKFREMGISVFIATLLSGCFAIILATHNFGVESLAWQPVIYAFVWSVAVNFYSTWRPKLIFNWNAISDLLRYSSYLTGHSTLNYWMRNGDNLLVGKVLGVYDLGIYSRAYQFMLLPLNNVGAVLGQVMFPSFSRLQDDVVLLRGMYLRTLKLIAFISFPTMIGMSYLSGPIVHILFGDAWIGVTPILRVMSIVGLLQSIVFPVGWIFTAKGRTREQFRLSVVLFIFFCLAMLGGLKFGVMGVTYAYAAWTCLSAFLNLTIAGKYVGTSVPEIFLTISSSLIITIMMLITIVLFDDLFFKSFADASRALLVILVGLCSYSIFCTLLSDLIFLELLKTLTDRLKK